MEDIKKLPDSEVEKIALSSRKTRSKLLSQQGRPGEVSRYMSLILEKWNKDGIDITDMKKVRRRINDYFRSLQASDVKPTLMGICNSLGITKATFQEWLRGKNCTREHRDIAQKAMGVLEEFWEMSVLNGRLSPEIGKFLGERQFGYTSVSEIIVTPNNPLDANKTEDELKRLYADNDVERTYIIEASGVDEKE